MVRRRRRELTGAALAVGLLALAGCSGSDESHEAGPATVSGGTSYGCDLGGGDVAVTTSDDGVLVAFEGLGLDAPSTGTLLYQVTAYDAAGETGVILGMKYIDGRAQAPFAFDTTNAFQYDLDDPFVDKDGKVSALFPHGQLGIARGVDLTSFNAVVSRDNTDVGTCKPV